VVQDRRLKALPDLTEGKVECRTPSGPVARIDTLAFSVPVKSDFNQIGLTATVLRTGTVEESFLWSGTLASGARIKLGRGGVVGIEASLPKVAGDGNIEALTLSDSLDVVRELVAEVVRERVTIDRERCGDPMRDAKVTRIDLPRDFDGVEHIPEVLDGLAGVSISGRVKKSRYADAECNRAETLWVGNGKHGGRLYDKARETARLLLGSRAPDGRLRFEAQLRSTVLTGVWARAVAGHVRQLGDLEEHKLRALRRASFERYGFDQEVSAMATVADRVWTAEGLSERQRRELWCFLTMPGYQSRAARDVVRRYRQIARSLGVTPHAAMSEALCPLRVRLDYDNGKEVVRAA